MAGAPSWNIGISPTAYTPLFYLLTEIGPKRKKHILVSQNTYGQESRGWIFLLKLVTFFVENIQNRNFFGKNDWSMNSEQGWAVDC